MEVIIIKPLIGIIERRDDNKLYLNDTYVNAVCKLGGVPIGLLFQMDNLTSNDKNNINRALNGISGIIFPGGTKWYESDEYVLQYCLNNKVPFLGICLGMQMIGNYFSINHVLGKDKTVLNNTFINHYCDATYAHPVMLKNGILSKLFKSNYIMVNSYHHYHVNDTMSCIIKGAAPDGIIEVLEIPNHPFGVGVQWHPEKMIEYDNNSRILIHEFIDQACIFENVKKMQK